MTLIVEDGSGLANAEAYASVNFVEAYLSSLGYSLWAPLSMSEKEQAIRRATRHLMGAYRGQWAGWRTTPTQALDWPRIWVPQHDVAGPYGGMTYYAANIVPIDVQKACAELSFRAASGELAPDQDRATVREKVGPIEVEYAPGAPLAMQFRTVDGLLAGFMAGATSGGSGITVTRS